MEMNDKGCCWQGNRSLGCMDSQTHRTYLLPRKVEARKTPHRRAKMQSSSPATKEKKEDNGRSKECGEASTFPHTVGLRLQRTQNISPSPGHWPSFPSVWGALHLASPRFQGWPFPIPTTFHFSVPDLQKPGNSDWPVKGRRGVGEWGWELGDRVRCAGTWVLNRSQRRLSIRPACRQSSLADPMGQRGSPETPGTRGECRPTWEGHGRAGIPEFDPSPRQTTFHF